MLKRILLICVLLVAIKVNAQTNLYVDSSISSSGAGTSWSAAFKTLSEALKVANAASLTTQYVISVAKGTYYPGGVASDTTRDTSFCILRGGVKLYGGFPSGGGTRNFSLNRTILNGNIGSSASTVDNIFHIMVIADIGPGSDSVVVGGFEFLNGSARFAGSKIYHSTTISHNLGGGLYMEDVYGGSLISDCVFSNNNAFSYGAGVYNSYANATFTNCSFNSNKAGFGAPSLYSPDGGAMYVTSDSIKILNSSFVGNSSRESGGGIFTFYRSLFVVENCTFTSNIAGDYGGGICAILGGGTTRYATIINCTFTQNSATNSTIQASSGGGLYTQNGLGINGSVRGCSFIRNFADNNGGGLSTSARVTQCTFDGNWVLYNGGGGAEAKNIDTCLFINNKAGDSGGGLYLKSGGTANFCRFFADTAASGGAIFPENSTTIANCIIGKNVASYGGGVYTEGNNTTTLRNTSIKGNTALINGGGVYAKSANFTAVSCLLAGNIAAAKGGAIYDSLSNPTITNSTFAADTAVNGNGIYNTKSSPVILNSIIWEGTGGIFNFNTSIPSITYSIVEGGYAGTGNTTGNPQFINPILASASPDTSGNFDVVSCSPAINTGLNSGSYTTLKDLANNPRLFGTTVDRGAYEYQSTVGGPAQPSAITGVTVTCNGVSQTYSVVVDPTVSSYTWSLPSGWTGTSTTNSITVIPNGTGGTISVTGSNGCGTSPARTLAVTGSSAPVQPGTISGNTSVCSGVAQTYFVTAVSGAISYLWTLPSGWSGTSTTNSILATPNSSGGTVSVSAVNSCGTSTVATQAITSLSIPNQPSSISGNAAACSGAVTTYSATLDPLATTYSWSLPSGWTGTSSTNSIAATPGTAGGTISVIAGNVCGSSTARTLTVTSSAIPAQPSAISGAAAVCSGASQIFSVTADPSVTTYNWTMPSGWTGTSTANSISVMPNATSGAISVTGTNYCGTSVARTLAVTSYTTPAQPAAITGSTSVCAGISQAYSVTSDPNITSYSWTLPTGWTGSSTTNSITATSSATGGTISITGTNSCGTSLAQNVSISVIPLPAQPSTITGPASVCSGVSQAYSVTLDPTVTSYNWTMPSGWSGTSATNAITVTTGTSSGTISVSGINTCGTGPSRTLAVTTTLTVIPTVSVAAGGGSTICAGTSVTFTPTVTSGGTTPAYNWRLNGSSVATGTTYASSSLANGDSVTVTITSAALCASPLSVTSAAVYMTVNSLPSTPTVSTPVVYCQNATAIQLTATGSSLKWYTTATGGIGSTTAPTPSTTSAGSTSYWVSQTNTSGCEGLRAQIVVNVTATPPTPVASSNTPVCVGDTLFLFASSSATSPVYSWTGPGFTSALQNPIIANTTAASAGLYRVTVTANGCVSAHDSVIVMVSCLDSIWAGDVNYDKLVDNFDALDIALTMGSTGPARAATSILWQPEHGRDWATMLPGYPAVNRKHADCDGDGTVAYGDTLAVATNYGLTHQKGIHTNAKQTAGDPDLYFDLTGITPRAGMTVTVPIKLGTAATAMLNITGLASRVMIDGVTPADTPTLSYSSSWLGTSGNTLRFCKAISSNRLDWAYARTDQRNTSGSGILAWITFTLPAGAQSQQMRLYFDRVKIVDSNGTVISAVNVLEDSATVLPNNTGVAINTKQSPGLIVLPNPSPGACIAQLTLPVAGHFSLEIRDISGRLIWQTLGDGKAGLNTINLPVDLVSSGVYLICLRSDGQAIAPVRWIKE